MDMIKKQSQIIEEIYDQTLELDMQLKKIKKYLMKILKEKRRHCLLKEVKQ